MSFWGTFHPESVGVTNMGVEVVEKGEWEDDWDNDHPSVFG